MTAEDARNRLQELYLTCSKDSQLLVLWTNVDSLLKEYAKKEVEKNRGRGASGFNAIQPQLEESLSMLYDLCVVKSILM